MRKTRTSDPELLAEWIDHRREPAFRELVSRYAGLVHATALRTSGDGSMAAEASQLTFILLARKASRLTSCASLGGWLHRTAVMQSKNLLRGKHREQRKLEQLAMAPHSPSHDDAWREMQPVLDESLAALSDKDREALLLRFYRALTVREVAETLGIATDAAQKRIDRATERLRGKLVRRGCQAGGSLGAVMLAGFATDTQAATVAVTVLTSKAIAAGMPATLAGSFTGLIFMSSKSAVFAGSLIVLSVIGVVFVLHFTKAMPEREAGTDNRRLERMELRRDIRNKSLASQDATAAIDWRTVGTRMMIARKAGDTARFQNLWSEIMPQLKAMNTARLSASLDEIAQLEMTSDTRDLLEDLLLDPLRYKNPELVLKRHFNSVSKPKSFPGSPFPMALMDWARNDPYAAAEWLDQQIADGTLQRVSANDKLIARLEMEASVLSGLMPIDLALALDRLRALPEAQRAVVLSRRPSLIPEADQLMYAEFARKELPKRDRMNAIVAPIRDLPLDKSYSPASDYMNRIEAVPTERGSCVEEAAIRRFMKIALERNVTHRDFDELRSWISTEAPHLTERITGVMLGKVARFGGLAANRLSFESAATIACEYQQVSGNDEVLYEFLKGCGSGHELQSKNLASRITDPKRRDEILNEMTDFENSNKMAPRTRDPNQ